MSDTAPQVPSVVKQPSAQAQMEKAVEAAMGRSLQENVTEALKRHWLLNARSIMEAAMRESPNSYLKTITSLVPKEVIVTEHRDPVREYFNGIPSSDVPQLIRELREYRETLGRHHRPSGVVLDGEVSRI